MRRWCSFLGLGFLLVACGGGGSPSPTANVAATTTRSAEQTQVSSVLTPAANGSAVARDTVGVGSPSSGLLLPTPQGTRTASSSTGAAPAGTSPAASSTTTQVVKVTASDGVNLRDKPDTNGQIVAKVDYGAELPMLEANVPGADGTSKWFRISYQGKTAFIRDDLVSGPQAPSPPLPPTPVASPGPTATTKP